MMSFNIPSLLRIDKHVDVLIVRFLNYVFPDGTTTDQSFF